MRNSRPRPGMANDGLTSAALQKGLTSSALETAVNRPPAATPAAPASTPATPQAPTSNNNTK